MTKSNWAALRSLALRAAVLGTALMLSACGGGGSDSSAPVASPATLGSIADVGVASITVAGGASPVYLMTGKQESMPVSLVPDSATSASDLSISYAGKGVLSATKDANGAWQVQVDAAVMGDGEAVPIQITITNTKLNKYAIASAQLSFVTPTVTSASIGSAGGAVGPPEFLIQVHPNNLVIPVGITVRRALLSDGTTVLFDVSLDADIGDASVKFRLPELPTSVSNSASVNKKRRTSVGRLDVVPTVWPDWWKNGALYNTDLSGDNAAVERWSAPRDYFFLEVGNGFRLASLEQCLSSIPIFDSPTCVVSRFPGTQKIASQLTSIASDKLDAADWKNFEPVLFVHGFDALDSIVPKLGGGPGTWKNFPDLAKSTSLTSPSSRLVPFEFRWNTNTSFKIAGKDLANAIQLIHDKTGKQVHVVAHSFGGVLARTVLEEIAMPDSGNASGFVASLLTLGAPHSGIAHEGISILGVDLPGGQDSFLFAGCNQVSCHEMGDLVEDFNKDKTMAALAGVSQDSGEIAALLQQYSSQLPPILIRVGIGLTVTADGKYGKGDALISFEGQRFQPFTLQSPLMRSLVDATMTGKAIVTEFILGINQDVSVLPGQSVKSNDQWWGGRDGGYYHSTAVPPFKADAEHDGVEPGPAFGCDKSGVVPWVDANQNAATFCPHAGYSAFASLMNAVEVAWLPGTPVVGSADTFTFTGANLQPGYAFTLSGCIAVEVTSTSTTQRQFVCTPSLAGTALAGELRSADGVLLKSFAVDVGGAPPQTTKFIDHFDDATLDTKKWAVSTGTTTCCGPGIPAEYSVANGFLDISVLGGSCGFCGVGDGSKFTPKIDSLTGDFESYISFIELTRTSRDGTGPMNSLLLSATDGSSDFGVYVVGDVVNNSGTRGHNIYVFAGGNIINTATRSLSVGQFYAMEFRIRRVGSNYYMGYKVAGDADWTEVNYAGFGSGLLMVPSFAAGAGDGGGTRINSSASFRIDTFTVSGSP